MPRVLLICEYATLNGGERSMLSTLRPLQLAGFEFVTLAPEQGALADAMRQLAINVIPFSLCTVAGQRRTVEDLRQNIAQAISNVRPDIVHANSLAMSRLVGPVTHSLKVRGLGHLRDIIRLSAQAAADINQLDRRLTVSAATRDFHIAQGLQAADTYVLHNGIDLELFAPQTTNGWLHRELRLPPTARLLATVGQISLRKGQDILAAALTKLSNRGVLPTDLYWLIIGERFSDKQESIDFETKLQMLANQGPLAGRVHMVGYRYDMQRVYPELEMLVHVARQEPLGRVLLEASACGVPIIASDVGGTHEIFPAECQAARLLEWRQSQDELSDQLAVAIREIAEDHALALQLGRNARARIENAFDLRNAAPNLGKHYSELIRTQ